MVCDTNSFSILEEKCLDRIPDRPLAIHGNYFDKYFYKHIKYFSNLQLVTHTSSHSH